MLSSFRRFVFQDDAQDLVEYAILAALISIVSLFALESLGFEVGVLFLHLRTYLRT